MAVDPSLKPLDPAAFGPAQAKHLLARAGFGGTAAQIAALARLGLHDAVDYLVDYQQVKDDIPGPQLDPDIVRPPTPEERRALQMARMNEDQNAAEQLKRMRNEQRRDDRAQYREIQDWWLRRMIQTPRPLEEKLVLLWHGHFASNFRTVRDSYLMYQQNAMFREHASGSFANLAHGIVHDPAMLDFLNNNRNHKSKPNENLARELMELFTLGEGNYTEDDIKQGARALTGYTVRDNDFVFAQRMHDEGEKTILGRSGSLNGNDFVSILLDRPPCAKFVACKLYRHFVADADNAAVIDALATELKAREYQLAPTLKTLLCSAHFYDPSIAGTKIKSPAQFIAGAVRTLQTPVRDLALLNDAMNMMGQELFNPPSVAGWHGGRAWINTSTLFARQNTATFLITGKLPFRENWSRDQVQYDPSFLLEGLASRQPAAVVDHVAGQVLTAPLAARNREVLLTFVSQRNDAKADTVLGLLLLMTTLPEYQLC